MRIGINGKQEIRVGMKGKLPRGRAILILDNGCRIEVDRSVPLIEQGYPINLREIVKVLLPVEDIREMFVQAISREILGPVAYREMMSSLPPRSER